MGQLAPLFRTHGPVQVANAGYRAGVRFLKTFTAQVCSPHTRREYFNRIDFGSS